ncbi:glycosyltransferase family 4 protein [Nocardioides sp.]|uniref:glycosyltransferase family 4 protein n=1 Tax=Nocardioides sp. TaxID=35761 RepID=UPI003784CBF0
MLVATSLSNGGAERRLLELVRAAHGRGIATSVVAVATAAPHPLTQDFAESGATVAFAPFRRPAGWLRLAGMLRKCAVVHTHIGIAGGVVACLGRLFGTPRRVVHIHLNELELPAGLAGRVLRRIGSRLVRRYATAVVGISQEALQASFGEDWAKDPRCSIVEPGIDLTRFDDVTAESTLREQLGAPDSSRVILHIGRDVPIKNRPQAMRLLAELGDSVHNVHLAFVGTIDERSRSEIETEAATLGVAPSVHWLGIREDVPSLLASADLLLLTSRNEGVPGVVLEALAAGCPVVATDLPGLRRVRDLLPEQVRLCPVDAPPRDWAREIAASFQWLNERAGEKLGLAKLTGTEYDSTVTVEKLMRIWRGETQRPLEVVHLFSHLGYGGAEVRTLELLQYLRPTPYSTVMFQTGGAKGPLTEDYLRAGADVITVRFRSLAFLKQARQHLRQVNAAAVHVHVMRGHERANLLILLAAWWGVPVRIVHFRNEGVLRRNGIHRIPEFVYHQIALRFATTIAGVSPGSLETALGRRWGSDPRAKLLLPGLDIEKFAGRTDRSYARQLLGLSANDRIVLVVGRDDPQKFREKAVQVFAELVRENQNVHLVIVGPSDRSVETLLADSNVLSAPVDRITMLGGRDDVPQLLGSADALLLTSRHEGLPGVVLESLTAGTPVLATRLPGTEFIADNVSEGITLVELSQSAASWARELENVLSREVDEELRSRIAARMEESRFVMKEVAGDYETVWGVRRFEESSTE